MKQLWKEGLNSDGQQTSITQTITSHLKSLKTKRSETCDRIKQVIGIPSSLSFWYSNSNNQGLPEVNEFL